ncbi:hypothetical protein GCM10010420_14890 [Streptomyces glaucosporus]|uniref:Uncharacterized protein n=1 Tax=Streptomyces glaucosporus TaxID=284044 RepID=A0ABN3I0U4_9ACTN
MPPLNGTGILRVADADTITRSVTTLKMLMDRTVVPPNDVPLRTGPEDGRKTVPAVEVTRRLRVGPGARPPDPLRTRAAPRAGSSGPRTRPAPARRFPITARVRDGALEAARRLLSAEAPLPWPAGPLVRLRT